MDIFLLFIFLTVGLTSTYFVGRFLGFHQVGKLCTFIHNRTKLTN